VIGVVDAVSGGAQLPVASIVTAGRTNSPDRRCGDLASDDGRDPMPIEVGGPAPIGHCRLTWLSREPAPTVF